MNFLELCKDVRRECGVTGTGPASVTGQTGEMQNIVEWTNKAYLDICRLWFNWKFLWDQKTIELQQGISRYSVEGVRIWDHRTFRLDGDLIAFMEHEKSVRDGWSPETDEYTPETVVELPNGDLLVSPVPDDNYTLTADCFIKAEELTGNNDLPLIPEEFHEVIVARAMIYYGSFENAVEVKQEGLDRYRIALDQLQSHQLPDDNHASQVNTGGDDIVVRPE